MADATSTIDWTREFSLPAAVPPALETAARATYLAENGLRAGWLLYDEAGAVAREPRFPGNRLARKLGSDGSILPRSVALPAAVIAADVAVSLKVLQTVGTQTWTAAKQRSGVTIKQAAAETFRWDDQALAFAPLPLPVNTDEGLVLFWPNAAAGAPLTAATPGIRTVNDASYLLPTSSTARDGEVDPHLLRSPAPACVRFERYRHLRQTGPTTLVTGRPSAAGAFTLLLPPRSAAMPAVRTPVYEEMRVVYDNVDIASAVECVTAIVVLNVLRWADITASGRFDKPLVAQTSWLLRAWLAYLKVIRPVRHAAEPDAAAALAAGLRKPFEGTKHGTRKQVEALLAAVLGDASARGSLLSFVERYYAPVACGRSWDELGVDLPVPAAARAAGTKDAHLTLEHLTRANDLWLVCYAGCPLGRPARAYEMPGTPAPADAGRWPLRGLSVFELEAVVGSGHGGDVYPDVTPPAAPGAGVPLDLSPYDAKSPGRYALLRMVNRVAGDQEYTTRDWLDEVVRGSHRQGVALAAPLDLAAYGGAAHPLAAPLEWARRQTALALRGSLDVLRTSGVNARIVSWWAARSGTDVGGNWLTARPGLPAAELPIGPVNAYAGSDEGGFDADDLEWALAVGALVKDGRDVTSPVAPALVLALTEREGYRMFARRDRAGLIGGWADHGNKVPTTPPRTVRRADLLALKIPDDQRGLKAFAQLDWVLYPYGLDDFNEFIKVDATMVATAAASFVDRAKRLSEVAPLDPEYLHRFAVRRLQGRFNGPTEDVQNRRRSRRLQWLGLLLQQAEFQRRHRLLHTGTYPTGTVEANKHLAVAEYRSPTPPTPGTDANSEQRRDYIAYYALLYLSFNVQPQTWNEWVAAAEANRPATVPVSRYLVYYTNTAPRAVEPTPPAVHHRTLVQRTNMLRFAVSLDAYLRMTDAGAPDTTDPAGRTW